MAQDELPEHLVCTLAYLFSFISGILLLTLEPYSKSRTIRIHSLQSILITAVFLIVWFTCALLTKVSGAFLTFLLGTIMTTSFFAFLGVWIYAMFHAYKRSPVEIPVISRLAEKFA